MLLVLVKARVLPTQVAFFGHERFVEPAVDRLVDDHGRGHLRPHLPFHFPRLNQTLTLQKSLLFFNSLLEFPTENQVLARFFISKSRLFIPISRSSSFNSSTKLHHFSSLSSLNPNSNSPKRTHSFAGAVNHQKPFDLLTNQSIKSQRTRKHIE